MQMSASERQAAKLRTQYDDAEKNRVLYENEVNRWINSNRQRSSLSIYFV